MIVSRRLNYLLRRRSAANNNGCAGNAQPDSRRNAKTARWARAVDQVGGKSSFLREHPFSLRGCHGPRSQHLLRCNGGAVA